MNHLDIQYIRQQFPATQSNFAYLDNAGGSLVLRRVADRIHEFLVNHSVQHGASYVESAKASEKVVNARKSIQSLINARHDEEVIMGGSTTLMLQILARAISPSIHPGDEIIVTNIDHEANIGPWERLCHDRGATLKVWKINPQTLELELNELKKLLSPNTKYVSMTHASNILGTVNPVAEVADLVHAVGAKLCVDAVAYAPHRLIDVQASKADFYVFSFYKVFGPHFAVLWGRHELLLNLPNLNHYFIGQDVLPYKLQPGNVNYELSYGCVGIKEYLVDVGTRLGEHGSERQRMEAAFKAFEVHEDQLAERLLSFLRSKPSVKIIGHSQIGHRVPTISFVVKDTPSERIVTAIDPLNIGIRFGDFYAKRLIEYLGIHHQGGVVRVSIAHYNTMDEIDRLISGLDKII